MVVDHADGQPLHARSAGDGYRLVVEWTRTALDELPQARTPDRNDWERLSQTWRSSLDERIAELEALRDKLSGCIGCGCLSLDTCALFNPEDRAAAAGVARITSSAIHQPLNRVRVQLRSQTHAASLPEP